MPSVRLLLPARSSDPVRRTAADQVAPLLDLCAALSRRWTFTLDTDGARQRLRRGAAAYNRLDVVLDAGTLDVPFLRATRALERAGLASNAEAAQARERLGEAPSLVAVWLAGEAPGRDALGGLARRAAALIARSILRRASAEARTAARDAQTARRTCPYCGSHAEFALASGTRRKLVCSRCDATWASSATGCLGCGAQDQPTLTRVVSRALGYTLALCHRCGRYLKERPAAPRLEPMVERALTTQLDEAAESRGFRL